MQKISEAALKKAILAFEAERLKNPPLFQPDRTQLSALHKARRASEAMVSAFLSEAGLDLDKLRLVQERRGADLERMIQQHKANALQRAATQKDTVHSSIAAQASALRDLAARNDFFPHPSFTLDRPFLIWSIPLQEISDSAAVPFGSWAKFNFTTSEYRGSQKFGFYFYWTNPYSDYAVINAATFLSATGHLKSHAPWTIGVNTSWVQAFALLNLWFGWPTAVTSVQRDRAFLGIAGAYGSFWTGGATDGMSISSGVSLNTTSIEPAMKSTLATPVRQP